MSTTQDDNASDIARLGDEWRTIQARGNMVKVPVTVYHDLDPVERTLRDGVDEATTRILIDDAQAVAQARACAASVV